MRAAIVYDFDGTLAAGDCAQHGLLPALEVGDISAFWSQVKEETKSRDGDEILVCVQGAGRSVAGLHA